MRRRAFVRGAIKIQFKTMETKAPRGTVITFIVADIILHTLSLYRIAFVFSIHTPFITYPNKYTQKIKPQIQQQSIVYTTNHIDKSSARLSARTNKRAARGVVVRRRPPQELTERQRI